MSLISPFYTQDQNGWVSVQKDAILTDDERKDVITDTTKMAFIELAKAAGNAGMLALVGLGAAAVAFAVFKIAAVIIGMIAFPAAIIPPLYEVLTAIGGLAAGGIVGYLFVNKFGDTFFSQMKEHFNYSMHLFSEAKSVYRLEIDA